MFRQTKGEGKNKMKVQLGEGSPLFQGKLKNQG